MNPNVLLPITEKVIIKIDKIKHDFEIFMHKDRICNTKHNCYIINMTSTTHY